MRTNKLFIAFLVLAATLPAVASDKFTGINDQFTYDAKCKSELSAILPKDSKEFPSKSLSETFDDLDRMVRIINTKSEDSDFRLQVMSPAEVYRASVFYDLNLVSKKDPAAAARIKEACALSPIENNLNFSEQFKLELLVDSDGVDSGS